MKKSSLLKATNVSVGTIFVIQALTGIAGPILPEKVFAVHQYTGYLFTCLVVAHVILNWTWIRSTYFSAKKTTSQKSA
jgi:hypothetical protein